MSEPWSMRRREVRRNIILKTLPTRPGLSGAMGNLDLLANPSGLKFDAKKAHRIGFVPSDGRVPMAIARPNWLFKMQTTVGEFGVVSSGQYSVGAFLRAPYTVGHCLWSVRDSSYYHFLTIQYYLAKTGSAQRSSKWQFPAY